MAQPAAVANTAQLRSVTSVPPARRSPSRRRQLQPVMHSLPSLPPSMLLATLHRIPMRIRCEWNVGTPSLALLLALLGYKLGRASVCPLPSAARASHWQCSALTSRRPNEVGRLLGRGACSLGAGKTQNALRCSAAPPSNLLKYVSCSAARGSPCRRSTGTAAVAHCTVGDARFAEGKIAQ